MRKPRCSAHPRALLTCKSPGAALGLWLGAAALMLTVLGAPQNSGLAGKLSTVPYSRRHRKPAPCCSAELSWADGGSPSVYSLPA